MSHTVESNAEGFYNFAALQPGAYSVSVEKTGFERLTQTGVDLSVNQNVRLDLPLRLGTTTQAVTVTGEAPLVDTRSPTLSGLVDDRRVVDLPLNGRNVIQLAATIPGVLSVKAAQQLSSARSGPESASVSFCEPTKCDAANCCCAEVRFGSWSERTAM